jgi:hypothetical protein
MYEIVNVIYGVVADRKLYNKISKVMSEKDPDWSGDMQEDLHDGLGFESDYHGGGEPPLYFGVEVDSWDCHETRPFVAYEITDDLKSKYKSKLGKLLKNFPDMEQFLSEPGLYYYGSSS